MCAYTSTAYIAVVLTISLHYTLALCNIHFRAVTKQQVQPDNSKCATCQQRRTETLIYMQCDLKMNAHGGRGGSLSAQCVRHAHSLALFTLQHVAVLAYVRTKANCILCTLSTAAATTATSSISEEDYYKSHCCVPTALKP
jgi:hypothetical protein